MPSHVDWVSEVETDAEGLNSLSLRETLEKWPSSKPKPKVLYTIPVCIELH
jgi:tryptophan aminotransferase